MYICVCNAITEEQLLRAKAKSSGPKEVLKHLKVGESCGVCLIEALKNLESSTQNYKEKKKP